jgi:uncharacterized Rossmann fold enzyme
MLISDEYREQNRKLHDSGVQYGQGGGRHALRVLDIRDEQECATVLDYGCGKGTLKRHLGNPDWMEEYDPAIPGKDSPARMADLVVCTDVMEHVEPECLDAVLADLFRVTAKVALLVIATRDSIKLLPDGTSPHKIIQDAAWWEAKLAEKFFVLSRETADGQVTFLVSPIHVIKEIRAKSAVSDTIRAENAFRNIAAVPGRVFSGNLSELPKRHGGRVCIVCYGPSLHYTWHTLEHERRTLGAKIVTVSGAHDFLLSRGIVPDAHVEVDPREHKCAFTANPDMRVTYQIASCCHPKLIDNLIEHGSKLELWHLYNSDNDFKICTPEGPDPGSFLICGGSGVGARAAMLYLALGYRSFSIYGMDSSFGPSGEQHAGTHSGKIKPETHVKVGERWFRSAMQMVFMAKAMRDQCFVMEATCKQTWKEPPLEGSEDCCEFLFHGDGLLQHMMAENNRLQVAT